MVIISCGQHRKGKKDNTKSCPTLEWMNCSLSGSSVHGILQARYWSGLPFPSPGIFSTQGLNPGLLHCRQILNHLSHQGSPLFTACVINTTCLSCNKSVLILCYHETRIEEKTDLTKQKSSTPNWQDCRITWSLLPTFLGFENVFSPLNNMDRTAFVLK